MMYIGKLNEDKKMTLQEFKKNILTMSIMLDYDYTQAAKYFSEYIINNQLDEVTELDELTSDIKKYILNLTNDTSDLCEEYKWFYNTFSFNNAKQEFIDLRNQNKSAEEIWEYAYSKYSADIDNVTKKYLQDTDILLTYFIELSAYLKHFEYYFYTITFLRNTLTKKAFIELVKSGYFDKQDIKTTAKIKRLIPKY